METTEPQTISVEEQAPDGAVTEAETPTESGGRRHRSTIAFPYTSLKEGEQIALELHEKWGDSATPEQLAGGLDSSPRSGSFRVKVTAARQFGLIAVSRGNLSLTPAGRRILDPQTRADARIEAFLAVPLFKALFDAYSGHSLPPDVGLEKKITELGVSEKQAARARQAFQRSAELAGFFKHGAGRLIRPSTKMPDSGPSESFDDRQDGDMPPLTGSTASLPPAVADLWLTLLQEGRSWSAEKTQEFVEAARKLHELLAPKS